MAFELFKYLIKALQRLCDFCTGSPSSSDGVKHFYPFPSPFNLSELSPKRLDPHRKPQNSASDM